MQSLAVRLYGEHDLRLERFDLPEIAEDEILADVVANSICMSDHKAVLQGARHKRVPKDIAENPIILGHEFCGTILAVGKKYQDKYQPGQKYSIQPALNIPGNEHAAPGYSFRWIGGHSTRIVIPKEVIELDCLIPYQGNSFFKAAIAEPVSCIIAAYRCSYQLVPGTFDQHIMGIKDGGSMAILAGAGPMGLSAIDLALHWPGHRPAKLAITDIDQARLDRAAQLFPVAYAAEKGVDLHYINTANTDDPIAHIKACNQGQGFNDVMVFAPVAPLIEQGSALLGFQGCLNFFAGPTRPDFKASINFYDVHYMGHHVVGSSGGSTQDLRDAMSYAAQGRVKPEVMLTHVGGIDSAAETTEKLPNIPGGKKLVYTHISMPMTAISDFAELGQDSPFFAGLAEICTKNNDLWSDEAEAYLLKNAPRLEQDSQI